MSMEIVQKLCARLFFVGAPAVGLGLLAALIQPELGLVILIFFLGLGWQITATHSERWEDMS